MGRSMKFSLSLFFVFLISRSLKTLPAIIRRGRKFCAACRSACVRKDPLSNTIIYASQPKVNRREVKLRTFYVKICRACGLRKFLTQNFLLTIAIAPGLVYNQRNAVHLRATRADAAQSFLFGVLWRKNSHYLQIPLAICTPRS